MAWLLLNLIVTWYMVGLIWLIQVVHYPLFANIPAAAFPDYERQHTHRTAWVVIGPMLLELFSALLLWWSPPPGLSSTLLGTTLGLLVLIWASTFWLQAPQHLRLSERYDSYAQQLLVQTNWIRTLAWTARGFLLAWALHQQLD